MKTQFARKPFKLNEKEFMYHFVKQADKLVSLTYDIDSFNKQLIKELYNYFSYSSDFDGDLTKGICVSGNYGVGKDSMFDAINNVFRSFMHPTFKPYHAKEIIDFYRGNDYASIVYIKQTHKHILIRDIGSDNAQIKHFGDTLNPLEDILLERYENFRNYRFLTHLTTNFSFEQLNARFTPRLQSRFREMFNFFYLEGPDRRC